MTQITKKEEMEQNKAKSLNLPCYGKGQSIEHQRLGKGIIVDVPTPLIIEVNFENYNKNKKILVQFGYKYMKTL